MALARPVVSTPLGAEGLRVGDGAELLLAERPADFAAACLRVLGDAGLARRLGEAGRAFVLARHDWRAIVPLLDALYSRLVRPG
jgi:glycosyltransferase involved in cell wall biosynthesis